MPDLIKGSKTKVPFCKKNQIQKSIYLFFSNKLLKFASISRNWTTKIKRLFGPNGKKSAVLTPALLTPIQENYHH